MTLVNPFDPGELPFDPGIRPFDPGTAAIENHRGAGGGGGAQVQKAAPCPLWPACQPLAAFVNPFDPGEWRFDPGKPPFDPGTAALEIRRGAGGGGGAQARRPPLALSGPPPDRRGAFPFDPGLI